MESTNSKPILVILDNLETLLGVEKGGQLVYPFLPFGEKDGDWGDGDG